MRIYLGLTLIGFIVISQAEESIGRLFSTPTERAVLNQMRLTKKEIAPQAIEEAVADVPVKLVPLPDNVTMQGYVKRSDGKLGTVWVNQQAIQENTKQADVTVGNISAKSNRVPIKLNANGKQLSLKAGQTFDSETNKIRESRSAVHGQAAESNPLSSGLIGDE